MTKSITVILLFFIFSLDAKVERVQTTNQIIFRYKSLIPRMESTLGYNNDQNQLKSSFNHYSIAPVVNLRSYSDTSYHHLQASIWNLPSDQPGNLRIGTLKIIEYGAKDVNYTICNKTEDKPIEMTDDEIIQTTHYYSTKRQQCVEQIFANSELKSFKFPRKSDSQEENPSKMLHKRNSRVIITQIVDSFNKQSKSIKVIKRNREINTLSSERISKVIRPNRYNISLQTQNFSYFSNKLSSEKYRDLDSKCREKNQSIDLELESVNTDLCQNDKFAMTDFKTSPHKNKPFSDPFECIQKAHYHHEYHKTDINTMSIQKNNGFKLNLDLSRNTSKEKIMTYDVKGKFELKKTGHTRNKSNYEQIIKSVRKVKNNKLERVKDKSESHKKNVSMKIMSATTNTTNASCSTKDSNLSGIKTAKYTSLQKKAEKAKGSKRNTYIPAKLKTQTLEEKLTNLLYKDGKNIVQPNQNNQNIKLFSKLKTVGIDRTKLQKTLKLYK